MKEKKQVVIVKQWGCLGFALLFELVLVPLKLTGLITASWWVVFAPLLVVFGGLTLICIAIVIFFICAIIYELMK